MNRVLVLAVVLLSASCDSCPPLLPCAEPPATGPLEPPSPVGDPDGPTDWPIPVGPSSRQATLRGPEGWDGTTPLPLVVLLHGYGVSAQIQDLLFGLTQELVNRDFLLLLPDGTEDDGGSAFWNATDACCDFERTGVDDVGYLTDLLDEVALDWAVDLERVYFTGHSNGGFMSYRMACDRADRIAAIAPLAGATWLDEAQCDASEAVSVLHIHGDNDDDVPYEGSLNEGVGYPGAVETASRWAARAGCAEDAVPGDPLDLVANLPNPDTRVQRWEADCEAGHSVELWTIEGGGHIPILDDSWAPSILDWLLSRRR